MLSSPSERAVQKRHDDVPAGRATRTPRTSRRDRHVVRGGFDGLFAVVALLAAVSALWIAGEGAGGTALLAAGTISLVVILRRRMQQVAATLAAARWRERYGKRAPSVGVNLSPSQLASPMVVAQVASVLRETDLPASSLTLEVACSLTQNDAEAQRRTLHLLREIGVRLAADDAGSGFATLGNLTRLPVDELKIDREFIRSLGRDPEDEAIVEAVTHLAHAREMRVVAEGLESEFLVVRVRDLGVDCGQGSFFANPLPLADAIALLDQQFAFAEAATEMEQVAD